MRYWNLHRVLKEMRIVSIFMELLRLLWIKFNNCTKLCIHLQKWRKRKYFILFLINLILNLVYQRKVTISIGRNFSWVLPLKQSIQKMSIKFWIIIWLLLWSCLKVYLQISIWKHFYSIEKYHSFWKMHLRSYLRIVRGRSI